MVAGSLGTEGHVWSWCGCPSPGVLNFTGCPAQSGAVLLLRGLEKPHSSQTLSRMSLCMSWKVSLLWIRALFFILFLKIRFFLLWQILMFLLRTLSELWGSQDFWELWHPNAVWVLFNGEVSPYNSCLPGFLDICAFRIMTNNNQNSPTVPGPHLQLLGALGGLSNSSRKLRLSHLVLDMPAPHLAAVLVLEWEGCLDAGVLENRVFCLVRVTMVGRHPGGIQSISLHLVLNKNSAL